MSLSISSLPRNYKSLTWFYTTDQKIVEWESGQLKYFNTKFKDRVRLDLQSGTLHIHNVQKEDSSTYLLMVLKDHGYEDEWKIPLVVLGELGEPKGKSPLQGPGQTTGRGLSLGGGGKNLRIGLIHFSWSQFHLEVRLGQPDSK